MASQLIAELQVSKSFVSHLSKNPTKFYFGKERSKMKFGREQRDDQGYPKKRFTLAPISFLKFKQRAINKYLQQIKLPKCMFGAVVGKNNIKNALKHVYADYFFTIDLKDFFLNISNKQINRVLRSHGFLWEDARLITKLCTTNRCLPQGAPTSSTLANIA
ncbi:MAG TPA: reverse transcriptase domain-containing protein, partial [Mucilaginibacter sp.]|nr:reverse transcriptase domain-containing protein [Mucilaginibacter sp.]